MSSTTPNLDDRRFQDLVDEARRMIELLVPEWTNLEPSDPGMVLVELFAWMSEMAIFRLNQVPDVFYTRMLDLLGIQPYPPSAARAVVTFELAPGTAEDVVVPAGTQVATSSREPVVFATTAELVIRQPAVVAAVTSPAGGVPVHVGARLLAGDDRVALFGDPPAPGDAFLIGFAGSLAGTLLELQLDLVPPPGVVVEQATMPVWEAWMGEGWMAATVEHDATRRLMRPGAVQVQMPNAHVALEVAGSRAFWLRLRSQAPRPGESSFQHAPQLTSVQVTAVGGAVDAEHSQAMPGEVLGISDGRPDQRFGTRTAPVLARGDGETVRTFADGATADWQEVASFVTSGPLDRHFTWDGSSGEIRFGPLIRYADGSARQHGAVPPAGAEVTVTGYRHGGGASGNVGAEALTVARATVPGVVRVGNRRRAIGGVDQETIENLKRRGPMVVRGGNQAVTFEDYERLVLEAVPEVARVRCLPPEAVGDPVRVLVVARPDERANVADIDQYALSESAVARIIAALEPRRVLGVSVQVGTPYFQGVAVNALLTAAPGRPAAMVRERAMEAITTYLDPIVGGRDGLGLPFGGELSDVTMYRLLESVEGVERVEDVVLFEVDLRNLTRIGFGRNTMRSTPATLFVPAFTQVVVR
ncbi:MAG TPA: putative baseplate assembly protein [Ilumatobacteraceae bacterium]|nr:putative baseplate assembly protein [Ilumatobacteraceae bacterium]